MKKKQIPIIILLVILVQITLQLIIPIHTIAAEEIVTIQCNDINFYNGLVKKLEGKIQSKNDTEKTITMTKTNVESVTSINLGNSDDTNDSLKITDITGIENFINLTNLRLYYNNISDINALSGLTNLTDLSLYHNNISDISALSGLTNLTDLRLYSNNISDISALSGLTNLTDLNLEDNIIQGTIAKNGIQEIELPQIIKAAKDSNSKIYTEEEYILTNCSLSEEGTKIIVNTDEVTEASIQIQGGNADGTKFTANIIVDTTPPELEIKYSTTEPTEENVIVTIIANEEIQIPDGWIEGEDKNIIYKEYDANTEETVVIKDLAGNETEANIKIENIIKKGNNGQNDDQTSGDETLADKEYPAAGIGKILLICIGVIIITGTIGFIKNKKYKNI